MAAKCQKENKILIRKNWFFMLMFEILMLEKSILAMTSPPKIAVIGGGASGMFSSISAAEAIASTPGRICNVLVFEGGRKLMTKVAISGGGRCNVLHDTTKPVNDILSSYPRGNKELTGLFSKRFTPSNAREWFESKGVQLKTESDGRMFPVTDSSQTIMDAIVQAAHDSNVVIETNRRVLSVSKGVDDLFTLHFYGGEVEKVDRALTKHASVILATGSTPIGHTIAKNLGHDIVLPVPSLFTLNSNQIVKNADGPLHGLAGVSVKKVKITFRVKVPGKKKTNIFQELNPVLITHQGFSGPAILRLSAFAAREFYNTNYKNCSIQCHWIPDLGSSTQDVFEFLWKQTKLSPKRLVASPCPLQLHTNDEREKQQIIPRRLWRALVLHSDIPETLSWVDAPKKLIMNLARNIAEFQIPVEGKSTFKEEFVTCGGITFKEINMKTMESKVCPGLFLCGEVIDVDGVTGGFNFMNCWSTGYVSGVSAVECAMARYDDTSSLI